MSWKIFLFVGVLTTSISAEKCTNETMKIMDDLYNNCREVFEKDFPLSTSHFTNNMLKSFRVYSYRLGNFANFENRTSLTDSSVLMLETLSLLKVLKDSPETMLIEFEKVLPKMSAGLRQIVSNQYDSMGKITNYINDDIKCLERSLKRLLEDFLRNGVGNLVFGKRTDFEPVMKCLQKLTNKIGQIAETILNDTRLSTQSVKESITILAIILSHCFVYVQGSETTFAAIIHAEKKRIPTTLMASLDSVDAFIVRLTKSIRSITDFAALTLQELLSSLVSLSDFLNHTLKIVFGLTTGVILNVNKITESLSCGVSGITQVLNIFG